jgi:polyisoprenoid-binding protein YceI
MREWIAIPGALALALAACRPTSEAETRPADAAAGPVATDTAAGSVDVAALGEADGRDARGSAQGVALQLVVAPEGNEVRYRVREQLVGFDLPNDAVGKTSRVTGGIAFDSAGRVVSQASGFTVDAATLASDRDRRDNYIRGRTLVTEQHPTITLRPTALRGLTLPLPTSGTKSLELGGDLTVRGVTRPTTWKVDARFQGDRVTGTASTAFTFADFELQQPRVRSVLSVSDTIRLEYDFALVTGK